MKQKLLKNMFLICMAVCLATVVIILAGVYRYVTDNSWRELESEAEYLAAAVEVNGTGFMEQLQKKPETRVTWIDADGTVLYDSDKNPSTMENHGKREEIVQAFQTGSGSSGRYSDTLAEQTVNYAVALNDGTVLRVSATRPSALSLVANLFSVILLVVTLAIGISFFLSSRLSQRLLEPINAINLSNPDERDVDPEIQPLVRRIAAQNRQIQAQMDQLKQEHEEQEAMRREFTANVSHELKTPLTSISGFAEIIRDGMVRPADIPQFAGKIYDEAQRLYTLVEDIIQLSRLDEQDSLHSQMEWVQLDDQAAEVLQYLQPQADKRGVTLQQTGEPVRVFGIRHVLEEMIYNLCDNAIKYNRRGGQATVHTADAPDGVVLTVSDTGIGIPDDQQSRVFERFYRVDKSRSKAVGGTGLGLSIVKHGAMLHRAQLRLTSVPGEGTTVEIRFPVQPITVPGKNEKNETERWDSA